jgi:2-hydroxy-3-keto-5-methylthiopentenyl-1-phosphate phosphatase
MPSRVRVFVDFDGTISLEDTTDVILERFAQPAWRQIEADWLAGAIGSRECLARQIDLVRASPRDLVGVVEDVPLDAHLAVLAALCRRGGPETFGGRPR